jgi:hypothetical protein
VATRGPDIRDRDEPSGNVVTSRKRLDLSNALFKATEGAGTLADRDPKLEPGVR